MTQTLRQATAQQFKDRASAYASDLRMLANRVELESQFVDEDTDAGGAAARMQHEIEWRMANANFAAVIRAAFEHDRAG